MSGMGLTQLVALTLSVFYHVAGVIALVAYFPVRPIKPVQSQPVVLICPGPPRVESRKEFRCAGAVIRPRMLIKKVDPRYPHLAMREYGGPAQRSFLAPLFSD